VAILPVAGRVVAAPDGRLAATHRHGWRRRPGGQVGRVRHRLPPRRARLHAPPATAPPAPVGRGGAAAPTPGAPRSPEHRARALARAEPGAGSVARAPAGGARGRIAPYPA